MSLLDRELPEPSFVDRDPATIVAAIVAQFEAETGRTLYPAQVERLLANVLAYRETLLREAIQDAAKLNLLRYSRSTALDMLGELLGVARLDGEEDDALRERIALAPERFTTAGSVGAYRFHARSAASNIVDVAVVCPEVALQDGVLVSVNGVPPGQVRLYPLMADGLPSQAVLDAVQAACSAETVRPVCDQVLTLAPEVIRLNLEIRLVPYSGSDLVLTLQTGKQAAAGYVTQLAGKLGCDVVRSQIDKAMHVTGVYRVDILQPAADVVLHAHQWPVFDSVSVTLAGAVDG